MNQWLEMVIKLPYFSSKCWLTVSGFTYLQVVPAFSGARQVQTSSISKAMAIQVVEFHVQGPISNEILMSDKRVLYSTVSGPNL